MSFFKKKAKNAIEKTKIIAFPARARRTSIARRCHDGNMRQRCHRVFGIFVVVAAAAAALLEVCCVILFHYFSPDGAK